MGNGLADHVDGSRRLEGNATPPLKASQTDISVCQPISASRAAASCVPREGKEMFGAAAWCPTGRSNRPETRPRHTLVTSFRAG